MKRSLRTCSLLLCAAAAPIVAAGCGDDAGPGPGGPDACTDSVELTNADLDGGMTLPPGTCWFVDENLSLDDGVLDIREGVTVTFATDRGLRVRPGGRVTMAGTAAAPIYLGTTDPLVTWTGIRLENS